MTDALLTPDAPSWDRQTAIDDLEQRVQRLEDATAALCDTEAVEERVRTRVLDDLRPEIERLRADLELMAAHRSQAADGSANGSSAGARSLFRDIWDDVSTLYRMLRDWRFPMSRSARIIPLFAIGYVVILPVIGLLLSWVLPFRPSVPLFHLDDVVVLYFGLKILGRELRRYRFWLRGSSEAAFAEVSS